LRLLAIAVGLSILGSLGGVIVASSFLLLSLAACEGPPPHTPKPTDARANAAPTPLPPVIDLTACVGKSLTLEEFVKTCQAASGFSFTYTEDTQHALAATSLRLFGDPRIESEQFEGFLGAQLGPNGFECKRIGPEHLHVYLIQRRAG
jgi:hypothetical protein